MDEPDFIDAMGRGFDHIADGFERIGEGFVRIFSRRREGKVLGDLGLREAFSSDKHKVAGWQDEVGPHQPSEAINPKKEYL